MRRSVPATISIVLLGQIPCPAALSIVAAGSDLDEPNWSTAGYGQLGSMFFAADDTAVTGSAALTTALVKSGPAWLGDPAGLATTSTTNDETPDVTLEGLARTGAIVRSGLNTDDNWGLMTVTFGSGAPEALRIGVLVGAQRFNTDVGVDIPTAVSIGERIGTATSGWVAQATDRSGLTATDFRADWYFFEVSGIQAGDTIAVGGQRADPTAPDKFVAINGLTFDVVPEPSALVLLGVGMAGFLRRHR